ncbi:MAG: hypothetical protein ABI342_04190 [Nitrososphaera sp.]
MIKKFIKGRKLELLYAGIVVSLLVFLNGFLLTAPQDQIKYAAIRIVPYAYPIIAISLFFFKVYLSSTRLSEVKITADSKKEYLIKAGLFSFNNTVFLFVDFVSLFAVFMSFYPVGFGPTSADFDRLHTIEPIISCGILPYFALWSQYLLDLKEN